MMLTKIFLLFAVLLTPTIVRAASAQPEPPYVGVSYYPEVAGDQMDDDIALMREAYAGVTSA
jgi:hypothetical protein